MESAFKWPMRHKQIVENTFDMHIPPDITFQFEGEENEINAHKWMMGMVSPVFNKMFFVVDTQDMHAKKLLIKGTSFGAFIIMKNAIYDITSMKNSLKDKSLFEVFTVLDLVTRYQISELQQAVRDHLASFALTDDNVLEVAANAKESSTFEDEAQQLFIRCAKFLEHKLKNARAVFKYLKDHKDEKDLVYELLALISDTPCANCGQEPCNKGEHRCHRGVAMVNASASKVQAGTLGTERSNKWSTGSGNVAWRGKEGPKKRLKLGVLTGYNKDIVRPDSMPRGLQVPEFIPRAEEKSKMPHSSADKVQASTLRTERSNKWSAGCGKVEKGQYSSWKDDQEKRGEDWDTLR